MAETPKIVNVSLNVVASQDTSEDGEFELYDESDPTDLKQAIGLAVGAASMTWPIVGGIFRDQKARRIADQLEAYILRRMPVADADYLRRQNMALRTSLEGRREAYKRITRRWLDASKELKATARELRMAKALSADLQERLDVQLHRAEAAEAALEMGDKERRELIRENGDLRNQLKGRDEVLDKMDDELRMEKQVSAAIDSSWTPLAPVPPQLVPSIRAFIAEYHRARAKHGEMTLDGTMAGDPATNDRLRLAALVEEVGEVAHEMTYDSQPADVEGGYLARLMKELVQVANLALTWHSYLVPGPTTGPGTVPAQTGYSVGQGSGTWDPQVPADAPLNVTVAEGAGWSIGGALEAVGEGSTVRVPLGMTAVLVPATMVQRVVNAVLKP